MNKHRNQVSFLLLLFLELSLKRKTLSGEKGLANIPANELRVIYACSKQLDGDQRLGVYEVRENEVLLFGHSMFQDVLSLLSPQSHFLELMIIRTIAIEPDAFRQHSTWDFATRFATFQSRIQPAFLSFAKTIASTGYC